MYIDPVTATGVPADVLEDIFTKYCGKGTPIPRRARLGRFFWMCKQYPTVWAAEEHFAVEYRHIHRQFVVSLNHLASVMNEYIGVWANRDFKDNKMPEAMEAFFDIEHTRTAVDSFQVYIQRPAKKQRRWYQHKYHAHVAKFQIMTDLKANVAWILGPHFRSTSDKKLWEWYKPSWLGPRWTLFWLTRRTRRPRSARCR